MTAMFSVTEKDSQTWATWAMHGVMRRVGMDTLVYGIKYLRGANSGRAEQPVGSPELDIPSSFLLRGCTVQHRVVSDFHVYDITPTKPNTATGPKKKLLYFAGGGFQSPATGGHWAFCAELANRIPNCTATLVSYPLAPANNAPGVYHLIQKAYLALLKESATKGESVILGGDSAGGNLSIGLPASTLKEDSKALFPSTILTISPAVEASHDNPDLLKIEPFDPMLSKAYCKNASSLWRGEWPTSEPRVSVLYADLSPLVEKKIHVVGVVGKYDCLAPDDMLFIEKSKKAGVSSEWLVWDKQMHCFPLGFTFGFPESVEAVTWIVNKLSQ